MEKHEYVKTGSYHLSHNQMCEDRILFAENSRMAAAVIADGVSTCTQASEGAETACRAVIDFLTDVDIFGELYSEEKLGYLLSEYILYRLEKTAASQSFSVDEYSSTVSFVYIDKLRHKSAVMTLGDSPVFQLRGTKIISPFQLTGRNKRPAMTTDHEAWKYMDIRFLDYDRGDTFFLCTDGFSEGTGRLGSGNISTLIKKRDYERLNQLLTAVDNHDDLSYIAISEE